MPATEPSQEPGNGRTGRRVGSRPARQYRPGRGRHAENTIMSALVRAGLVPRSYLLTTQGRRTGKPRTNPVVPVEHDGRRWLVAPYGPVSWVHNARAAGRVTLTRRRDTRQYAIREVAPNRPPPSSSDTSASPPPPDGISWRPRTPQWRTSSPRQTATLYSSSHQ